MPIVWWIIVGLLAGWLTGKTMRGHGYGYGWDPWMDIIIGIRSHSRRFHHVVRCFLRPGWNDLLLPWLRLWAP